MNRSKRLWLMTLGGGVAGFIWAACSSDSPAASGVPVPRVLSLSEQRRIEDSRLAVAWIGAMHNDIQRSLKRLEIPALRRSNPVAACERVVQAVADYRQRIEGISGSRLSNETFQRALQAGLSRVSDCRPSRPMSLFAALAVAAQSDSNVTGAYVPYAAAIESGLSLTDGTPGQVQGVTSAVLASATSLGWADFIALSTAATVADSSSAYWQEDLAAGGGGGGDGEKQMVLWRRNQLARLAVIILADFLGCSLAMEGARNQGVENVLALGLICLLSAAVSSGLARAI